MDGSRALLGNPFELGFLGSQDPPSFVDGLFWQEFSWWGGKGLDLLLVILVLRVQ